MSAQNFYRFLERGAGFHWKNRAMDWAHVERWWDDAAVAATTDSYRIHAVWGYEELVGHRFPFARTRMDKAPGSLPSLRSIAESVQPDILYTIDVNKTRRLLKGLERHKELNVANWISHKGALYLGSAEGLSFVSSFSTKEPSPGGLLRCNVRYMLDALMGDKIFFGWSSQQPLVPYLLGTPSVACAYIMMMDAPDVDGRSSTNAMHG